MTQGSYGGSLTGGTFGTQQSAYSQGTVGTTTGGGRRSLDSVATGLTGMTQDTLVTISGDDMTSFLNAVSKKDAELRSEKEEFQRKAEQEQDDLVKKVSELQARLSTIQVSLFCVCLRFLPSVFFGSFAFVRHYIRAFLTLSFAFLFFRFFRMRRPGSRQRSKRLFKRASLSSHLARPTRRSARAILMRPRNWPPRLVRRPMPPTAMLA